ncbi:hypothetical protein [Algoriphagus sp. A40]|uniref:plasmid mobilization protein n=1 Tax=Algoriphagus sp. A40 TaxID=1945863 RepID=UPI00098542E8|nr:hypothetical protein [Algoriphagus sp. A40]OOG76436.1 hypothetical protein B0E43_08065 [Algoriphagus sp. A40]
MEKMDENKRNKWLHIRLTDRELVKIRAYSEETIQQSLSDFARRILLKKPVIGRYRDTGTEDLLRELFALRRDLHGLASNYNQLVKKLHSEPEIEGKTLSIQAQDLGENIRDSLEKLQGFMDKITEKWLQS